MPRNWGSTFNTGKMPAASEADSLAAALDCPSFQARNLDIASRRHAGCAPDEFDPLGVSGLPRTSSWAALHAGSGESEANYTGSFPAMKRDQMPFADWDSLPSERPPAMQALRTWLTQLFR